MSLLTLFSSFLSKTSRVRSRFTKNMINPMALLNTATSSIKTLNPSNDGHCGVYTLIMAHKFVLNESVTTENVRYNIGRVASSTFTDAKAHEAYAAFIQQPVWLQESEISLYSAKILKKNLFIIFVSTKRNEKRQKVGYVTYKMCVLVFDPVNNDGWIGIFNSHNSHYELFVKHSKVRKEEMTCVFTENEVNALLVAFGEEAVDKPVIPAENLSAYFDPTEYVMIENDDVLDERVYKPRKRRRFCETEEDKREVAVVEDDSRVMEDDRKVAVVEDDSRVVEDARKAAVMAGVREVAMVEEARVDDVREEDILDLTIGRDEEDEDDEEDNGLNYIFIDLTQDEDCNI